MMLVVALRSRNMRLTRVFAKTNICLFLQLYMRRLSEHKYLCFGGLRRRRFKFRFHFCLPGLIDLRRERLRKILTSEIIDLPRQTSHVSQTAGL